ncbi:uncharacterized protein Tco025E_06950, partial [Trypanosoma conorhini]
EHVERFARRWWRYRIESRLLRCLADEAANTGDNHDSRGSGSHGEDAFRENIFYLKKGLAEADTRTAMAVKPRATLIPQTRQLAAQCIAATTAPSAASGEARHIPAVSIPPTLPLAVRQLDTREPQLCPRASPEQPRGEGDEGGTTTTTTTAAAAAEEVSSLMPPLNTMAGVSFTLRVCKSAFVELAAAHLSSCRAEFRLPVRCLWHPSERRVDISIEKPLPGHRESRRNINAAALKRLVDGEPRLPSNSRCSVRGRQKGKCCAEVSFGAEFAFHLLSNCVFDLTHQCPVFRMIKMEYNCKGYSTVPDDEKTFHYEGFSKREVVRMWVLLHCNPTAVLYVYRINAYSSAVMGIEQFSSVSFMSQVMGSWAGDVDVQRSWGCLCEGLRSTVSAVVRRMPPADGASGATFILAKEKEDGNVSLCSVKACYPQQVVLEEAVAAFIEPSSRTVCRREYLPPCVWPFPDRIPYTYAPAPKSCYVVNRTTEARHDSAYYAKHDVWEHESRYYAVDEHGAVRELQPASS